MLYIKIAAGIGVLLLLLLAVMIVLSRKIFGRGSSTYDVTKALSGKPELLNRILEGQESLKKYTPEEVEITSYDGLRLTGSLYRAPEPTDRYIVCMHGFHSGSASDFAGAVDFFIENHFHVLLVTQRCHGKSEGKSITFGVKERYDCRSWCRYLTERFGEKIKIVLDGVSMGATTVMMASDRAVGLPDNVRAIIADCGYTSPWEIVCDVAKKAYHLPAFPAVYLLRAVTKWTAGFDLKEMSAVDAVRNTDIPIFFAHGTGDKLVPYEMSKKTYAACASDRVLFSADGAGHGLSFIVEEERYKQECAAFLEKHLSE